MESITVTAAFGVKGDWEISLSEEEFLFTNIASKKSFVVKEDDFHAKLYTLTFGQDMLVAPVPRNAGFTLKGDDLEKVNDYLGSPKKKHLANYLKTQGMNWTLALGGVLLFVGLPILSDNIDWLSISLGTMWLVYSLGCRFFVHPILLIINIFCYLLIFGYGGYLLYQSSFKSILGWGISLFCLFTAKQSWKVYQRFKMV